MRGLGIKEFQIHTSEKKTVWSNTLCSELQNLRQMWSAQVFPRKSKHSGKPAHRPGVRDWGTILSSHSSHPQNSLGMATGISRVDVLNLKWDWWTRWGFPSPLKSETSILKQFAICLPSLAYCQWLYSWASAGGNLRENVLWRGNTSPNILHQGLHSQGLSSLSAPRKINLGPRSPSEPCHFFPTDTASSRTSRGGRGSSSSEQPARRIFPQKKAEWEYYADHS